MYAHLLLCCLLIFYSTIQADVGVRKHTTNRVNIAAAYPTTAQTLHQLLHTKLEVSFDWEEACLHGTATLQVKPRCYPQRYLVLDAVRKYHGTRS